MVVGVQGHDQGKTGSLCVGGGWAPGSVWTGAENLATHSDSIPGPSRPQHVALPTELHRSVIGINKMDAAAARLCPQCAVTCHVYLLNRVSLSHCRNIQAMSNAVQSVHSVETS
jgi:hypothetical protein